MARWVPICPAHSLGPFYDPNHTMARLSPLAARKPGQPGQDRRYGPALRSGSSISVSPCLGLGLFLCLHVCVWVYFCLSVSVSVCVCVHVCLSAGTRAGPRDAPRRRRRCRSPPQRPAAGPRPALPTPPAAPRRGGRVWLCHQICGHAEIRFASIPLPMFFGTRSLEHSGKLALFI